MLIAIDVYQRHKVTQDPQEDKYMTLWLSHRKEHVEQ